MSAKNQIKRLILHHTHSMTDFKLCNEYIAFLRGLYLLHQNFHWLTSGPNFYGNHLLFERLYKSAQENADLAAEKFIGVYGKESVDFKLQALNIAKIMAKFSGNDYLSSALEAEKEFLKLSDEFYGILKETNSITLGVDDMILSIASAREEAIYLLQQSNGDNEMNKKISNLVEKFEKKLAQVAPMALKPAPTSGLEKVPSTPELSLKSNKPSDVQKVGNPVDAIKADLKGKLGLDMGGLNLTVVSVKPNAKGNREVTYNYSMNSKLKAAAEAKAKALGTTLAAMLDAAAMAATGATSSLAIVNA